MNNNCIYIYIYIHLLCYNNEKESHLIVDPVRRVNTLASDKLTFNPAAVQEVRVTPLEFREQVIRTGARFSENKPHYYRRLCAGPETRRYQRQRGLPPGAT